MNGAARETQFQEQNWIGSNILECGAAQDYSKVQAGVTRRETPPGYILYNSREKQNGNSILGPLCDENLYIEWMNMEGMGMYIV